MADEIKVDDVVNELSKPENKAELEQTLSNAFNEGTQTADAKTAEAKPAEKTGTEEPANADDPSKKAGEVNEKKSRVELLLEDRNVAEATAANAQTEVQTLTKQVENLTKVIETLTGKDGAGAQPGNTDDAADDKPMTKKEAKEYVENLLKEKSEASTKSEAADKSITDQIQALETNKETPHAKDFTAEIKSAMVKFPGMKAYAAYCMLVGANVIPGVGASASNANRTGTGNRSKTNLLDNTKPGDMSQAEAFAFLKGAEKSGDLEGLI
jgi:polyhydroxyalkanoate synthesis regulator phasin